MPERDGESREIDFKEVIISLMFQMEVMLNCMIEKGLITREEFARSVDELKQKRKS